ncbi:SGNH/GDSL hydrolase family protein [bacterium]|nr:SGNH/GDSL hydrolase family protein [bacterium]
MLIAAGLVIVTAAVAWKYFVYSRPVGTGPAGPTVDRRAFAEEWSTRPVVLLGLGDSVTQGLGASPGKSYFQRLVKNPPDEFVDLREINLAHVLPNLESLNISISGMTSIECVDHQLPKLEPYPPEVFGAVVITVGGNDVVHNYGRTPPREGAMYGAALEQIGEWPQHFNERLETIATRVRETFPGGSHIFIADIYDPTDGDSDTQYAGLPAWPDGSAVLNVWNDVIRAFAERHDDISLIEMRTAFLGHGIHCVQFWHHAYRSDDPTYWYWDNLEDPNDRGYDAIRRLFLNEIARVLPGRLAERSSPVGQLQSLTR